MIKILIELRNKILIINMALTSTLLLIAFVIIFATTHMRINMENKMKLNEAVSYLDSYNSSFRAFEVIHDPMFVVIIDSGGIIIDKGSPLEISDDMYEKAVSLTYDNDSMIELNDRLWMYEITEGVIVEPISDNDLISLLSVNTKITFLDVTDTFRSIRQLLITLISVGIIMTGVVLIASYLFANRAIKPVESAWAKQRQFITDASHELKTPLTIITSNIDAVLINENDTIKNQKEWFDYIKIGTNRMSELIDELLSLAHIENPKFYVNNELLNISQLITEEMKHYQSLIHQKHINIDVIIEPDINIKSDKNLLIQVFNIMYDNAIKYTYANGSIKVTLIRERKNIIFSVSNTCENINKKDLLNIFDRFYRADHSHSSIIEGHGLGLSIAYQIVNLLGGDIKVASIDGVIVFTLILK